MKGQERSLFRVREQVIRSITVVFMIACWNSGPAWAIFADSSGKEEREKKSVHEDKDIGVKNFGKVNDHIYRGGQPDDDEYAKLAASGIRTILDLRDDARSKARLLAEKASMKYINLRLNSKRPPTTQESNQFLALVNDQTNWPVYVHCAGGRHRTGVLVAVYRMEKDGWDAERAYGEMKDYKFYTIFGHGAMKDYVYRYYKDVAERRSRMAPEVEAQAIPTSSQ